MVILGTLWIFEPRMIAGQDKFSITYRGLGVDMNPWFLATFFSSLFSAAKGIAQFLLHGPCTLLTKDGHFSGMGTFGFLLLTLNIILSIVCKLELGGLAYGGYFKSQSIFDHKVSFF